MESIKPIRRTAINPADLVNMGPNTLIFDSFAVLKAMDILLALYWGKPFGELADDWAETYELIKNVTRCAKKNKTVILSRHTLRRLNELYRNGKKL